VEAVEAEEAEEAVEAEAAVAVRAEEAVEAISGWLGLRQNPRTIGSATKGAIILSYIIVVLRLTYINIP
jgi:hypothetical protein